MSASKGGGLVVKRKVREFVVISHGGEELLVQVRTENSLYFVGPQSFGILRSELTEVNQMPPQGNLGVTRTRGSYLVINHGGEVLRVRFSERTRVICNGPLSFGISREEQDDQSYPKAA